MKFTKLSYFFLFLPAIITIFLFKNNFELKTNDFLTLLLQLVWGIMVSLGGSILFLNNYDFNMEIGTHKVRKEISDRIQAISLILIFHTLIFILISVFYPIRIYLKEKFHISGQDYLNIARVSDCALFSLILIPAIAAIAVGIWCLYIAIYHKKIKTSDSEGKK